MVSAYSIAARQMSCWWLGVGVDNGDAEEIRRRELVTEFGTRLAIVKGYVQLLNRHVDRPEIPREQLMRYCRILGEHLILLEDSAKNLLSRTDADALLNEQAPPHVPDDDTHSSAAS